MPQAGLSVDVAIGVTIPARDARGRAARIGPVLDSILSAHNYPPVVERLLAEALILTALLGSLLKDPQGQMTLQAQTENGAIDLLVCDVLMPGLDGASVLNRLVAERPRQAVIVLSCLTATATKVRCLEAGAEDYLAKPFSMDELLARVRARLRADPRSDERHTARRASGSGCGPRTRRYVGPPTLTEPTTSRAATPRLLWTFPSIIKQLTRVEIR